MPSATIWDQYTLIAVIVVIMVGLYTGVIRIWKMAREAQKEDREVEYQKRERERSVDNLERKKEKEDQRAWQTEQNALREKEQAQRDQTWREFFERNTASQTKAIIANSEILAQLVTQLQALTLDIRQHDTWARERLGSGKRKSPTGDIPQ